MGLAAALAGKNGRVSHSYWKEWFVFEVYQIQRKKLEEDDGIVDRSPLYPNQEDQVQTSVSFSRRVERLFFASSALCRKNRKCRRTRSTWIVTVEWNHLSNRARNDYLFDNSDLSQKQPRVHRPDWNCLHCVESKGTTIESGISYKA